MPRTANAVYVESKQLPFGLFVTQIFQVIPIVGSAWIKKRWN